MTVERARDHLANERTYLAWLRTALAVVALGAVLARVDDTGGGRAAVAAAIVMVFGAALLGYGTRRYYRVSADLDAGRFEPARRGPLSVSVAAVIAVAIVVPLLLA